MAEEEEEEKKEGEGAEEEAPPKKKGLLLGGGILGCVVLAFALSAVLKPSGPVAPPSFEGPFVISPLTQDVQVNLSDAKRFLVMNFQVEYDAYDEPYTAGRVADPLFQAKLLDALIRLGRKQKPTELEDTVGEEVFTAKIRQAIDPLLFPVHVGNPADPNGSDEKSGIAPGTSAHLSTMRDGFKSTMLDVDGTKRTLSLDGGPEVTFEGTEDDLLVENARGHRVFVDVTRFKEEFVGKVPVGTFGHAKRILLNKFLVQ